MSVPEAPLVGAVAVRDRALAPDVARGAMLLLIALANVHLYLYDRPLGVRLYPAGLTGVDAVVAGLQLVVVDGRAYPLFGMLLGYGLGQLAARGAAAGAEPGSVVALIRRRGWWLVAIGVAHVVLLWSGDIVAAYGLLTVGFAGMVVRGTAVSLLTTAVVGSVMGVAFGAFSGFPQGGTAPLRSIAMPGAVAAAVARLAEWAGGTLISSLISVVGAVAFGAWAARYRVLDEPAVHRRLLGRVAVAGLVTAVVAGLPLALAAVGGWRPGLGTLLLAGSVHTLGGYAGGLGYAALFGLLAARASVRRTALSSEPIRRASRSSETVVPASTLRPVEARAGRPGVVLRALAAGGQRSLSCYLGQSVLFCAVLPAWTLGLGARLSVAQAALLAVGVWLVLLLTATASARAGDRGPAETLLRRLTYGRPGRAPSPPALR